MFLYHAAMLYFNLECFFKNNEVLFLGIVSEIRLCAENNKDRRCTYSDGYFEDLSLIQLRILSRFFSFT